MGLLDNPLEITLLGALMFLLLLASSAVQAALVHHDDVPAGDVVNAEFDGRSLKIYWKGNFSAVAQLSNEEEENCIYHGSFVKDAKSKVLVTGCAGEELAIQFHSEKFGDEIFSVEPDGDLKREIDEDFEETEYVFYSDEYDEPLLENNGRVRRQDDYEDYYDFDLSEFQSNELEDLPSLEDYEVDDEALPTKIEVQLNIYIDPAFRRKHGRNTKTVARQIVAQAGQLYRHSSLNTKVQLVHNNRFYYSNTHLKFNSRRTVYNEFYKVLPRLLRAPYSIDGHPVAHMYLTVPDGRKATGVALAGSICDKATNVRGRPRAIVGWRSVAVTGVTFAHELGHILGMYHDFKTEKSEGRSAREKCSREKFSGRFILSYGNSPRRAIWSDCSNDDFKTYYFKRTYSKSGEFCLLGENSNIKKCRGNEYQCPRGGQCIPDSQRCDGIRRHCPGGDDEIDCPFDYDD